MLLTRAGELEAEITRSRVLAAAEVHTERVMFGTRVHLENKATGESRVYTILGPAESDPAENVLSYLSPLGQTIVGKKVGEEVGLSLDDAVSQCLVKQIENALV